jgi:Ca2+:H+ antiporter
MSPRDLLRPSLDWLLIFVPVTVVLESTAPERGTWIFLSACLSIIPLAGWMGHATEHLAEKTGEGVGGLLNATFGNAAEMIIAIMALREGLVDIVKASLTGSILGNLLLVMGASFLAGGMRFREQKFNAPGARMLATMMILAALGLLVPAAFHHLASSEGLSHERALSTEIAVVLLFTYLASLLFSLRTHKHLFTGTSAEAAEVETGHGEPWGLGKSITVLAVATALIAWVSEMLVATVEPAADAFGMSHVFIGVIVVAVIGNAAEHSTSILVAVKNRMDLSVGIAIGSSVQVALFVAPVLVLLSYLIGPQPMDLVFTPFEVLSVVAAVWVAAQIAGDGRSDWLEGVQLVAVYIVLAMVFYFLPEG